MWTTFWVRCKSNWVFEDFTLFSGKLNYSYSTFKKCIFFGCKLFTLSNCIKLLKDFYSIYVLRSLSDSKFYVGFTSDLMQRFEGHNTGKVPSTKNRRPLELVYFEGCRSKEDAIHREKYLKTFYGKMFIHRRLKSYLTG